jgi:MYXO-CTERM domain-containing protein
MTALGGASGGVAGSAAPTTGGSATSAGGSAAGDAAGTAGSNTAPTGGTPTTRGGSANVIGTDNGSDSGCTCQVSGAARSHAAWTALAALMLLVLRRRRVH